MNSFVVVVALKRINSTVERKEKKSGQNVNQKLNSYVIDNAREVNSMYIYDQRKELWDRA